MTDREDIPTKANSAQGFYEPWKPDASLFFEAVERSADGRGDRQKLRNLRLIAPAELKDFESNSTLVVAGDRGTGKSLILARKAAQRLDQAANSRSRYLTLLDRPPFVSLLVPGAISLPLKEYRRYSAPKTWKLMWLVVLKAHFACMSARARNDPQVRDLNFLLKQYFDLPDAPTNQVAREFIAQIWNAFHVRETIGAALLFLVQRGVSNDELGRWSAFTNEAIQRATEPQWEQAIFIDGIDEALGDPQGDSLFNGLRLGTLLQPDLSSGTADERAHEGRSTMRQLALDVMLHAQTGFIQAADSIRTEFSTLKCYGAVRREAGEWMLNPENTGILIEKLKGVVLSVIEYKREQLGKIFDLNVEYSDEELADRDAVNPSRRLYGFRAIRHSSVLGKAGEEEVRDLLVRHTFGVPRQLVSVAKATLDAAPQPQSRRQRVDDIVNAIDHYAATTLWADYISAVNPPWFEEHASGLGTIEHNVLGFEDIAHLERIHPGLASFLYARGMVGHPVGKPGSIVLEFHRANGEEVRLPDKFDYVVLHPVLSAYLCRTKSPLQRRDFYISDFVVGEGMTCPTRVVKPLFRVVYEGEQRWTLAIDDKLIDFKSLIGSDENPLLAARNSSRAAFFLLLVVVMAIKRHKVEWVS